MTRGAINRNGLPEAEREPTGAGALVRVLHVVAHPVQYFAPLYRDLVSHHDIDLTVCYYSEHGVRRGRDPGFGQDLQWDVPLLGGYRHRFLTGADRPLGRLKPRGTWEVVRMVASRGFDVVWLHGYNCVDTWQIVLVCRVLGVPVVVRDDATLLDARTLSRRLVKAVVLPALFRFSHFLYVGSQNRRFFERYGVPDHRLFFAPHSVDNEFFRQQASTLSTQREALRRCFGLRDDGPVVLFCGKLISKKDPLTLLRAFASVRERLVCSLLFVGDGPLRESIVSVAEREAIRDVRAAGFLNQSSISRAYAVADILVLPSRERETWGLAVNEAMNFGLGVIVSDKVGCGCDVVIPGQNGVIVPAGAVTDLADAIYGLISDRDRLSSWGERSKEIIDEYAVSRTAEGIANAARELTRRKSSSSARWSQRVRGRFVS